MPVRVPIACFAAACLLALPAPAPAASSYDACAGFIPSLPATISTQGVWCLDKDLATALTTGNAISITTNNVTIDCNGFKLGGLAGGPATAMVGIGASDRSNITIRDCNLRGFATGVELEGGGGGHRVEGNRFDGNTTAGMIVSGDGSIVRDNQVRDTGGSEFPATAWIFGIGVIGHVDVLDNQIVGVDGAATASDSAIGILVLAPSGNTVARNRIGAVLSMNDNAYGLAVLTGGLLDVRENTFGGAPESMSVFCYDDGQLLHDNALLMGPVSAACHDGGGNYGWAFPSP